MISIRLRDAMDRHHTQTGVRLTYEQLAAETGLSIATLQSLASRSNYNTTLNTIEKLCRALKCEPGELLQLVDPET